MKATFFEKLIDRLDRLDPAEVQSYVLRIAQEKGSLEQVFDALREGVIVTSAEVDDGVLYINRAACKLFGLDRNSTIGEPIQTVIRGLDWEALTRDRKVVSRDLEIFYPENRFVNFYIAPLENPNASPEDSPGYVLLLRDITESRADQEQQIESEKINAVTQLAAGVAHEIGNPLNSLNIHLQLVERKLAKKADPALAAELGELLEISRNEIKRLDGIVDRFLTAVRPQEPAFALGDLNEIVTESVRFLAPEIEARGIEIAVRLNADLPPLRLDRDQLKQAFYNLMRNAAQAIGSGESGRLTIRTGFDDLRAYVSFADTGNGIDPENVDRVFDPYFTTKKTGSGLGLLIVHRVVREHGGEIQFGSEAGHGTEVKIYLPRAERQTRFLPPAAKKEDTVLDV